MSLFPFNHTHFFLVVTRCICTLTLASCLNLSLTGMVWLGGGQGWEKGPSGRERLTTIVEAKVVLCAFSLALLTILPTRIQQPLPFFIFFFLVLFLPLSCLDLPALLLQALSHPPPPFTREGREGTCSFPRVLYPLCPLFSVRKEQKQKSMLWRASGGRRRRRKG